MPFGKRRTQLSANSTHEDDQFSAAGQLPLLPAKAFPARKKSIQKSTRSETKRRLKLSGSKTKPGLAVDTSFSHHKSRAPQQIFPYESQTQEQRYVSLADIEHAKGGKRGLKYQLENRSPSKPPAHRSISKGLQAPGRPSNKTGAFQRSKTADVLTVPDTELFSTVTPALHKRIGGLRPSPLDLTDVSPSDRAIPIGICIPSAALSYHEAAPHAPVSLGSRTPPRSGNRVGLGDEAITPTIIITPAREDFGVTISPDDLDHDLSYRPPSSVYSRYTNCMPQAAKYQPTPTMPLLPLFATAQLQQPAVSRTTHESTMTIFEEQQPEEGKRNQALSVCTTFEEYSSTQPEQESSADEPRLRRSDSVIPTPRRSKGWWNLITSPFSAKSQSNFWRSPTEEHGSMPMLSAAAEMGHEEPRGFESDAFTEPELRSAPAEHQRDLSKGLIAPTSVLQRSFTSPAVLDPNGGPVNIYRIPSQGEAAAYYDPSRIFPSPSDKSAEFERGDIACGEGRALQSDNDYFGTQAELDNAALQVCSTGIIHEPTHEKGQFIGRYRTGEDARDDGGANQAGEVTADRHLAPARPVNERSATETTMESQLSPLSATPVIETAHIGTVLGPHTNNGERRKVTIIPGRTPSPPSTNTPMNTAADVPPRAVSHGLGAEREVLSGKSLAPKRAMHARQDSHGLGISDSHAELFPAQVYSEKVALTTDRHKQVAASNIKYSAGPRPPWYRRFLWVIVSMFALLILLLVLLLVMFVTQGHHDMAVQSQWLNLSGFPALPTGVATVIQPNLVKQQNGCVQPSDLWTCAAPPNQHSGPSSTQPSFRLEIRFKNGTLPPKETNLGNSTLGRRSGHAVSTRSMLRKRALEGRDAWTDALFASSPTPPSTAEQVFLGNTTDGDQAPFDGEKTPFYISFVNASELVKPQRLVKRQGFSYPYPTIPSASNSSSSSSDVNTAAASSIPLSDAAADVLYPFPTAQPLQLHNRGKDEEYYGFYSYFDRTLVVSRNQTSVPSMAGHSGIGNNSAVCTWSQTRFKVQIWTQKRQASQHPGSPVNNSRAALGSSNRSIDAVDSTANDMSTPGSFPYPVTLTLDRHGGLASGKGVYCYGLNADGQVVTGEKEWVPENRGFGGSLMNPAIVPSSNSTVATRRDGGSSFDGIDGGTGGCGCIWQN